uniref:Homeobox domain-containing protein n=1 Tax=Capitella teleta TaxID=283909 RepID=X2BAK3_CAPTE
MNELATHVLTEWYIANRHHAYPSKQCVAEMAEKGHVTTAQVSKWFANKRRR